MVQPINEVTQDLLKSYFGPVQLARRDRMRNFQKLQGGAPVRERVQLFLFQYVFTFGLMNGGYIELDHGDYKPTNITGAPPCMVD